MDSSAANYSKALNPNPTPRSPIPSTFLKSDGYSLLILLFSFFLFFGNWFLHPSQVFLSLDTNDIYYPFYHWVHECFQDGRLPLISDFSYHGAPMPAVVIVGFLSPVLALCQGFKNYDLTFNVIFLVPWMIFLLGSYALGRILRFSTTASLLLAFLWTYNGQRMAHLDHLNITWACAFFPWVFAFLALFRQKKGRAICLWTAGLLWGLGLLSGHPQIIFEQGLFFVFWALWAPDQTEGRPRWLDVVLLTVLALWVAAPWILNSAECLAFDGLHFQWNEVNRFYHSWTPLNFITLVFPWFFGKYQFDRQGFDYWWQYQFTEMQVAFSVVGLFFILLFFMKKNPWRKFVAITAIFSVLLAMGRFTPFYSMIQALPGFSWFRDPARYWFLASWALGLGAAQAWDRWWTDLSDLESRGRKLAAGIGLLALGFIGFGWMLLTQGRALLTLAGSWMIQRYLLESSPPHSLSGYLDRIPEKLNHVAANLNPIEPRVYLPLLFLVLLNWVIWNRRGISPAWGRGILLALVLLDLAVFRTPLGRVFYNPGDLPAPQIPAVQSRLLCFLSGSVSPLPYQYALMAYANVNYLEHIPTLPMEANPQMNRYADTAEKLGWFSWVYKDRDPRGFTHHVGMMRAFGLDLFVSDLPMTLPSVFKPVQTRFPYSWKLSPVLPKASLVQTYRVVPYPQCLDVMEYPGFDPLHEVTLDAFPGFQLADKKSNLSPPQILHWAETRLSLFNSSPDSALLVLQKTFLPGWKAWIDGNPVRPLRCDAVLTALWLPAGPHHIELQYDPTGLKLGFFFFLVFMGIFSFLAIRSVLA